MRSKKATLDDITLVLARRFEISRFEAEQLAMAIFSYIESELKQGHEVSLRDFGSFKLATPLSNRSKPLTQERAESARLRAAFKNAPKVSHTLTSHAEQLDELDLDSNVLLAKRLGLTEKAQQS